MTTGIHIQKVEVGIQVAVPETVVEANVGYLPWVLGENLAGMVDSYVMEKGLGYYPALDFFRDKVDVVDPALLLLIDQVAMFCVEFTRREFRRRLSHAFSHVQVDDAKCTAYAIPRARPSHAQAPQALAEHYTPKNIKLVMTLSSIHKRPIETIDELAMHKLSRNAREAFEDFRLLNTRIIQPA